MTRHACWAVMLIGAVGLSGMVEPGKYADLAVWDRDPYRVPTADLKEMKCLLTVFNGRIVFRAASSPVDTGR